MRQLVHRRLAQHQVIVYSVMLAGLVFQAQMSHCLPIIVYFTVMSTALV